MPGLCQRWEGGIPCTMWQESSCFAFCETGRDQPPVRGAEEERGRGQAQRWRYCTSYFPLTSLPGNGSSCAGVSAVLLEAGDEDGMCAFSLMERTSGRPREQGKHDENKCSDNSRCPAADRVHTVRLRPNWATATTLDIAELDHPPINDGGTRWQSRKWACE